MSIVEELETFIEMQGFVKGTKAFESELRREKVQRCMQMQELDSCTNCARFTECELRLAYWRATVLKDTK